VVRNPRRSLAPNRPNGRSFADKISAIGVWLKNGVRDNIASLEVGTRTRPKMFDICLLGVYTLAVAVAAADIQERDDSQRSQDSAASHNACYD
jgi:hypothetical protein